MLSRLLVGYCQYPSDRLANDVAANRQREIRHTISISLSDVRLEGDKHLRQLGSRSTSDFLYAQSQEIMLEFSQLLNQVGLVPAKKDRKAAARDQSEGVPQLHITE